MTSNLEPIIRKIEQRKQAKPGRTVVVIHRKTGQAMPEATLLDFAMRVLQDVVLYEITTEEWLRIDNAGAPIAVFPTNERPDLAFRIRVKAPKDTAVKVAEALHSLEFTPAEVLFCVVNDYIRKLLEDATKQGPDSAVERIAQNRLTWQAEIARVITSKLHLDAEIIFENQRPIFDTDVVIRAVGIPAVPCDAQNAPPFPTTVSVVLARARARATEPLPIAQQERQNLVRDIVIKVFRDRISLFTYWYEPDELKKLITNALIEEIARYGHAVTSVSVDPIVPPVPAEEVVRAEISWSGRLARPIPFHVEAKVRMTNAGLFHGQKVNRKDWIRAEVDKALNLAMHGRDFIDLTAEAEDEVHKEVHRRLNQQAGAIGHGVETFVASTSIPEKIWLKPTPVSVERREYKTKNALVPAELEIDLIVELTTLARLEHIIQNQRLTRPNDTGDGANAAIRAAIAESAVRAASRVMSQIEPSAYFAEYERWSIPMDDTVDTSQNYVRNQLVRAIVADLKAEFMAGRCRVNPRRVDSSVTEIIRRIQQLGDIEVKTRVEPMGSKGPHQAVEVTLNYFIGSIDPNELANIIQRGDNSLPRDRLAKDLKDWTTENLNGRPLSELESLSSANNVSLVVIDQLNKSVGGRVRYHYGVVVGIKSATTGHSDAKDAERRYLALPVREQEARLKTIERAFEEEGEPSDEELDRQFMRSRVAVLEKKIAENPRMNNDDRRRLEQDEDELNRIRERLTAANKGIIRNPRLRLESSRGPGPASPAEEETAPSAMRDITPQGNDDL